MTWAATLAFLVWSATLAAAAESRAATATVAACIRDVRCHRTFVVAHRAHGFRAPENSREAVTRAVEAGIPIIKIDVRASKDGDLYLLHDGALDRATNLRGRIETFTSAQLAGARLANGESLPTFSDVYEITRGRALLTVGFKAGAVEHVDGWQGLAGTMYDLVFYVAT